MNNHVEILIVEDSLTQAEQLKYILEQHDYRVSVVNNGKEALAYMSRHKPKLVISDIIMPEMDGYQLCERIKTTENFKNIPVILVTALSDPEDVINGLECGADNFIVKPYDEKYLLSNVRHILINKELGTRESVKMVMEIFFKEKKYFITADRLQILNLLLSTYETAVQKNLELIKAQEELKILNGQLEEKMIERTADLKAEIAERKRAEEEMKKLEKALQKRVKELEEFYDMAVGRELRMKELKEEIERLKKKLWT
jgi:DNA-binding response OmpR family regulator